MEQRKCSKCGNNIEDYIVVDGVKIRTPKTRKRCYSCSKRLVMTKVINGTKLCKTCKNILPVEKFYTIKSGHGGKTLLLTVKIVFIGRKKNVYVVIKIRL
jgi:hypothetical protein